MDCGKLNFGDCKIINKLVLAALWQLTNRVHKHFSSLKGRTREDVRIVIAHPVHITKIRSNFQ